MIRILALLLLLSSALGAQEVVIPLYYEYSYNHHQMGDQRVLALTADTNTTPTACGNWYDQLPGQRICFNYFDAPNAPDNPNQNDYTSVTFDMRKNVNVHNAYVYVDNYFDTKQTVLNEMRLMFGTPYVWEDTLPIVKADPETTFNKWVKFNVINFGHTSRFFHLETGRFFGAIRRVVITGTVVDTLVRPASPSPVARNVNDRFGAVAIFGDGKGKLTPANGVFAEATDFDASVKFDWVRIFESARYKMDSSDNLIESGQGMNALEIIYADKFYDSGVKYFYAIPGLTNVSQVDPDHPNHTDLSNQKPIDWQKGRYQKYLNGKPLFDSIGAIPASYDHAAYNLKKLAAAWGGRPKPMSIIEIGNENDGRYQEGYMNPDEMAAFCSAAYDGHENTITYLGQSVGVKNSGVDILCSMPGVANIDENYFQTMAFNFFWTRSDHKFASDVIAGHAYPTTIGVQGGGRGINPENAVTKYRKRLEFLVRFRDSLARHAIVSNGETGVDCFEKRVGDTSDYFNGDPAQINYCAKAVYGNSFVNAPDIFGVSIPENHGRLVSRFLLANAAAGVDMTLNYFLADRIQHNTTCGTFYASGLCQLDTIIGYVPYYTLRPAWYYFKTVDTLLKKMKFISETVTIKAGDTVQVQTYQSTIDPLKFVIAAWCPTSQNMAVGDFHIPFGGSANYVTKRMDVGSEVGTTQIVSSGTGLNTPLNEKPLFILVTLTGGSPAIKIRKGIGKTTHL